MQNVGAAEAVATHLIERVADVGAHEGEVIGSAGLGLRGYQDAPSAAGNPFDAGS